MIGDSGQEISYRFGLLSQIKKGKSGKCMKKIKYLSYYAQADNNFQKRNIVLAAINKIDYICKALNKAGYFVEMISASNTKDKKHCYKGLYKEISHMRSLRLFFTFPWGNRVQKMLSFISMRCFLLMELMKLKKNEKFIVYHSLGYMKLVDFAHRIKKFHLILEVEEIYTDVDGDTKEREKEVDFLKSADSYIFSTELLNQSINVEKKPYVVIYGTYQVEQDRRCKFGDRQLQEKSVPVIHCVYAGTFDLRKGGAAAAVAAAAFLPSHYHVHILGFGSESDIKSLKAFLAECENKYKCKVTFDGCLSGEEYICFIQNCDIGLSTQNPNADFNNTSFPSKILSYLGNGLRVVSIRIPAIELSSIGKYIYYYDRPEPEEIAAAILKVDINKPYDSRKVIMDLSDRFEAEIANMLK